MAFKRGYVQAGNFVLQPCHTTLGQLASADLQIIDFPAPLRNYHLQGRHASEHKKKEKRKKRKRGRGLPLARDWLQQP